MVTVKELRQSGNKVRVLHTRNVSPDGSLSCLGGTTVVEITTKDGRNLFGSAKCRDDERFDRKMGLKIALGRAMVSTSKPSDLFDAKKNSCGLVRMVIFFAILVSCGNYANAAVKGKVLVSEGEGESVKTHLFESEQEKIGGFSSEAIKRFPEANNLVVMCDGTLLTYVKRDSKWIVCLIKDWTQDSIDGREIK